MGEIFSRDELKQCNKEVLITLFLYTVNHEYMLAGLEREDGVNE